MSEEIQPKPLTQQEEVAALNKAFDDSAIHFHDRATALAALKEGGRQIVWQDGTPHIVYDSIQLPLPDALKRFGFDRRDLVDGRTLPKQGLGTSRPSVLGRDSFSSDSEKVAWIKEHGYEAWQKLPSRGVQVTSELKTFADWTKLPTAEKVRLIGEDPNIISKLAPGQPSRPGGVYINHEAMERIRKIRGGR